MITVIIKKATNEYVLISYLLYLYPVNFVVSNFHSKKLFATDVCV